MSTKLAKWGNSFAFRISPAIAERLNLSLGDVMVLDIKKNSIVLSPQNIQKYKSKLVPMRELLKGFKGEGKEYWDDEPVGKEIW
jgi:antitoxin component of MazEF toxin-antitoxin module